MNDTNSAVAWKFYEMMKRKSNEERLLMGFSMYDTAKEIVKSSIYMQQPKIGLIEIKREIFLRFYGAEFKVSEKKKILHVLSHSI